MKKYGEDFLSLVKGRLLETYTEGSGIRQQVEGFCYSIKQLELDKLLSKSIGELTDSELYMLWLSKYANDTWGATDFEGGMLKLQLKDGVFYNKKTKISTVEELIVTVLSFIAKID